MSYSNELRWLEENKQAAMAADTWDRFCDSVKMGGFYRNYGWLQKHWQFLKKRGFLTWQTIAFPDALHYSDLFSEAKLTAQVNNPKGGTIYPHPPGMFSITTLRLTPDPCGNYGGRRGWSKVTPAKSFGDPWKHELTLDPSEAQKDGAGDPIRAHYGATFYVCSVRPKFEWNGGGFEAIKRDDGILIVGNWHRFIGSDWLALLDANEDIETLLPPADREFLAAERAAEIAAWGTK